MTVPTHHPARPGPSPPMNSNNDNDSKNKNKMPPCMNRRRRPRHIRHHRMPTFGVHRSRLAGSPLYTTITRFGTSHVLRRGHTLDRCMSPAGLHPLAKSVTDHLRRLYEELKGPGGEALSRDSFLRFIQETQRDKKLPSWAFSEKCEPFTFKQFEHLWWAEYSAAKRPIHIEDKDLDQPISNYFISSSHNTYIEDGNQITGEAKALQYKKVLESGCRCVEIDVWNGLEADDDTDSLAPAKSRSTHSREKKNKKKRQQQQQQQQQQKPNTHWSFSSMVSWMRDTCQATTRSMTFPRSLKSKKSEASFKAKPPVRAMELARMMDDSESAIASMLKREPRVCHAYETYAGDVTLHQSIPFRTVCRTIKESAFTHGNELPVIISLEVHANASQQEKMVEIMRDEWGDLLLDEVLPHCHPEEKQPTLGDLKNKILIKVKTGSQATGPPRQQQGQQQQQPSDPSDDSGSSTLKGSETSDYSAFSSQTYGETAREEAQGHHQHKEMAPKKFICDALKKLAIYTYSPGHFTSFDIDDAKKPAHIYSFGEEKLKALHRTEHNDLFKHNRGFLARTFPESLSSFLSSNPNYPTLFWRKGVQMVALNWQVWDTAMELNDAMFDHEQGWVLKPPGYRSSETRANCQADVAGKKLDLSITVLAGQHIPSDNHSQSSGGTMRINPAAVDADHLRPRVTCFLHVESAAERNPKKSISKDDISRKTRTAKTEQPDWGSSGSRLHFPTVRHVVEEVSFVRFYVEHCGHGWPDRTAWACIRLDRLQEGYRLIKLKTDDGYKSDGLLLVKIEKKLSEEVPRSLSLRRKTWNLCKDEVTQLKSRWSCMG